MKIQDLFKNIKIDNPMEIAKLNDNFTTLISLGKSINDPIDSPNLREFLKGANKILIIVNDATRTTPTAEVISEIYEEIKSYNVTFIVAVGTHRDLTEKEYQQIFGKFRNQFKIIIHDSKKSEMTYLGTTSRGTEVKINSLAVICDKIIVIGSVEPHYFAGYTGGRKSILPGIAAYNTIEQNHKLALLPDSSILNLEGNSVHEDMIEACRMLKTDIFAIMTIIDSQKNIRFAASGDIFSSHTICCQQADDIFSYRMKEKADIIISFVNPSLNIDLYQSQKALENGKNALKKNGIFILISECFDGIGNDNFYKLLSSCKTAKQVQEKIQVNYKLGWHKAAKLADFIEYAQLWAVTNLADEVLTKIYIKPFATVTQAIQEAIKQKGKHAKILIIPDGGNIVPRIN